MYDAEKYITDTLNAVLRQTWKNIEIVIVDDGSRDNSLSIAKRYESSNVKVISQKNKGACASRNRGLLDATGEYIQYLDADDILSPGKIEEQIKVLQRSGKNTIASCGWAHFAGNISDAVFYPQKVWKNYEDPHRWLEDAWLGGGMMQTACWLTPRSIIEKTTGWDMRLTQNQDGEFFCRVLLQSGNIAFTNTSKVYYRVPGDLNISSQKSKMAISSLLESYHSYELNILKVDDYPNIRVALGTNYLNFIYQYNDSFPDLAEKAKRYFRNLGFTKMWPVGGIRFKLVSKIVGVENALKIRKGVASLVNAFKETGPTPFLIRQT
jgi:glycosyltransferase involved in cell wall biosynthesis